MDRDERCREHARRIREVYPDLVIATVRPIEAGQYNDVLLVDGELIFRFPRFAEGVRTLATETAILRGLRGAITLPIPDPIYRSLDSGIVGQAFTGYRLIPGEPLWLDTFRAIDDEATLDRLAGQLATFLRELHGVPVEGAIACELPVPDHRAHWSDLYARIRAKLFPHMSPAARERVGEHFEAVLDDWESFAFKPVLVHGDFGTGNILFDARAGAIAGVVDFGSAHLDDPALDVAALASYGEPFLRRAAVAYPAIEATLDRTRFYRGTFALQEALYGVEHGDPRAFERGIVRYR